MPAIKWLINLNLRKCPTTYPSSFATAPVGKADGSVVRHLVRVQPPPETLPDDVDHTFKVMSAIDNALLQLQDAETGQRGFIITGDESYLARSRPVEKTR